MILSIFLIILGYLMGSVCSAVIVCKSCSLPDPRTTGSKNPGATNVLRLAGKKYAVMVLVTDILKGAIPVLIAQMLQASPAVIAYTALAAVIGHMFPVFFGFKGGKGVATAIGALLGFQFVVGFLVAGTWLAVAKIFHYSSLASIVAICLAPFYAILLTGRIDIFAPIFFMALLVLIKHYANIGRLLDGTESKIKFKQQSILEEVLEDDPSPVIEEPIVIKKATVKTAEPANDSPTVKPKKPTAAKTTKTVNKKASKTESTEKKAKPAKKAIAPKAKTKKPAAKNISKEQ